MEKGEIAGDSRPLLTAVMPIYNGERHLRETLDHIVKIQARDMELLLIDDGSTDASGAICREYEALDARIRYVRQENQGIAASRNRGLALAGGEYVCFWDQDDIVIPENYFSLLYKIRAKHACMGICSTARMIRGEMSVFEKLAEGISRGDEVKRSLLYPLLFRGYGYPFAGTQNYLYGSVWKCIFRTDFIRDHHIRFARFVNYEDDWIFVTHALCCADQVVTCAAAGYCWRVNESSESHSGRYVPDLGDRFTVLDEYVSGYLEAGIQDEEVLSEYRKINLCEHYVELYRNAANMKGAHGERKALRRKYHEHVKEYLRRTDYRSQLTVRKYLRSSAYRKRIILSSLRYGGIEVTYIISGIYDRIESRLSQIRWVTRMERRHKMKQDQEASDETDYSDTLL